MIVEVTPLGCAGQLFYRMVDALLQDDRVPLAAILDAIDLADREVREAGRPEADA